MISLLRKMQASPVAARVAPFLIFLGLTFLQGAFGEASRYWIYLAKTLVGAWLLWMTWSFVEEMRWKVSWEAVVVGVGVCGMWIALGHVFLKPGEKPWDPNAQFGAGSGMAWFFIAVRVAGSTLVVPPLEEVFYRSYLYRFIANPRFETVSLAYFSWIPFVVAAAIFGSTHGPLWLAGILCAFAYQGLVIYKRRLGDAMTAHAITNFLLGLWVVWKGEWQFW